MTTYSYNRLLEELQTIEDVRLVAHEIDMLLVHLYKADKNIFAQALNTTLQRNLTDALTLSLTEQNVSLDKHDEVQQYFTGLKQFIATLPVLQLTVAYHPSNEQIMKLTEWARQHTKKPIVLHLNYNKDILGGAIVTFEGRYTDLSLKKKLATAYESKREQLLAMLG